MASNTLFPPVVNSTEPAFVTTRSAIGNSDPDPNKGFLKVYFKYSALNSGLTPEQLADMTVHATILSKSGGKVLNTNNDLSSTPPRLRNAGMILNLVPGQDSPDSDYWFVTLRNDDVNTHCNPNNDLENEYYGWIPGEIYKIQLRLSDVKCTETEDIKYQQIWLNRNADHFSEWSPVVYSKCISEMLVSSTCAYEFNDQVQTIRYPQTFQGNIEAQDSISNEYYSYCKVQLKEYYSNTLLEEQTIYPTNTSHTSFNYTFKYNFIDGDSYALGFYFVTDNQYQSNPYIIRFIYSNSGVGTCDLKLKTVDTSEKIIKHTDFDNNHYIISQTFTSLGEENDEGRIGLKLVWDETKEVPSSINTNYYIIRSDELNNFTNWEDIKVIPIKMTDITSLEDLQERLDNLDIIYDYSIESDIFYKYGIQSIDTSTYFRSLINQMEEPILRDFEYSYLLGKNQIQLKLKFNNVINSFTRQINDTKLETLGSQFPFIGRNSKVKYKTFPVTGTISFEMDDNKTFLPGGDIDIYGSEQVRDLHKARDIKEEINKKYDRGYERRFRQKVLDFLQDGEIKLLKSPTEGNILVRLRDVNCTPNQTTNRLIYDFSANVDEIDNCTMYNLLQYGLVYPGTYVTNLENSTIPSILPINHTTPEPEVDKINELHSHINLPRQEKVDPETGDPIMDYTVDPPQPIIVKIPTPTNIPPGSDKKEGTWIWI